MEQGHLGIRNQIQQDRNPSQTTKPMWLTEQTLDYCEGPHEGRWLIWRDMRDKNYLDDYDNIWKAIKILVQRNRIKRALCSTVGQGLFTKGKKGLIICHTSDFTKMDDVRTAAEDIVTAMRPATLHGPMFYKPLYGLTKGKSMFNYTENHKFFHRNYEGTWTLVKANRIQQLETDADRSYEELLWKQVQTPDFICDGSVGYWYIRGNIQPEAFEKLFIVTWKAIAELVKGGSTSIKRVLCYTDTSPLAKGPRGLIMCFTSDYTDINDVTNAAELITRSVSWGEDLYYKQYIPTLLNNDQNEISIYKYKNSTLFYREPMELEWTPVVENRCPYPYK